MAYTPPANHEYRVFLCSIPDVVLTSVNENIQVDVYPDTLYATPVFTATYAPDLDATVRFNIADIFRSYMHTDLPSTDIYLQQHVYMGFGFKVTGMDSGTVWMNYYNVLLSRFEADDNPWTYMKTHYNTLQPREKSVTKESPEHLTLYHIGPVTPLQLYARFYPKTGGSTDVALTRPTYSGMNTYRFNWDTLWKLRPGNCYQYVDIVAIDNGDDQMTQRYIYSRQTGKEHYFLWVNALGGIDTVTFQGANIMQPKVTHNIGRNNGLPVQLDDSDDYVEWRQLSGWFPWRQREWLCDFISSKLGHWIYDQDNNTYAKIVVTSSQMEASDDGQHFQFSFTYRLVKKANTMGAASQESTFSQAVTWAAEKIDYDDTQVVEKEE